jgi:hypothetical protein
MAIDKSSDPFDEFEFKPLTEGLGFHRKTEITNFESTQEQSNSSTSTSLNKKPRIEFALTNSSTNFINEPSLSDASSKGQPPTTSTTVDDILRTLSERKKYDFTEDLKLSQPQENKMKLSHFELSAALLDGMLIIASFLTSLIVLLVITKVDLFGNLLTPDEDGMIYYSLAGLFAGLCWMYLIVNRMFLGFTPGEWVFDQRIGKVEQLGTASYSLGIVMRSTIIIATGLILLPLASMISGKDWIGKLFNVQTFKKA